MRAQAPSVGIHLPTPNDSTAAQTANQMKASEKRYWPTFPRSMKNVLNVVTAVMHSRPPIQTGFDSQYRTRVDRGHEAPPRELASRRSSRPRR